MIIKAESVSGEEYYAMVEQRDRMREQAQTSRTVAQGRDGLLKQVAAVLNRRPVSLYDLEEVAGVPASWLQEYEWVDGYGY